MKSGAQAHHFTVLWCAFAWLVTPYGLSHFEIMRTLGRNAPWGNMPREFLIANTKKLSDKAHGSIFPTWHTTCFSGLRVQHQARNDFARQLQCGLLFELSAEQGESA